MWGISPEEAYTSISLIQTTNHLNQVLGYIFVIVHRLKRCWALLVYNQHFCGLRGTSILHIATTWKRFPIDCALPNQYSFWRFSSRKVEGRHTNILLVFLFTWRILFWIVQCAWNSSGMDVANWAIEYWRWTRHSWTSIFWDICFSEGG